MRRDLNRFRHRRRNRMQMLIVFTVAVLGALALVSIRSCTNRFDGMQQQEANPLGIPAGQDLHLDKDRLQKLRELKKLMEKEGMH